MELLALGKSGETPSYLLKLNQCNILLDCAIDFHSLCYLKANVDPTKSPNGNDQRQPNKQDNLSGEKSFPFETSSSNDSRTLLSVGDAETIRLHTPHFDFLNINTLDAIVISNQFNIMALPFLTEKMDFQGKVFATQATIDFGSVLLKEIVEFSSRSASQNTWLDDESIEEISLDIRQHLQDLEVLNWKSVYTLEEVESCIQKITPLSFGEEVMVSPFTLIKPVSSSFCIGSCNWIIKSYNKTLGYVSASSSTTNRHPKEVDLSSLQNLDAILMTDLSPEVNPEINTGSMINEFIRIISLTFEKNGSVIIPCNPCGIVFDLLDCVFNFLLSVQTSTPVPVYFISPSAKEAAELAESSENFLCSAKLENMNSESGPFLHSVQIKSKKLRIVNHITPSLKSTLESQQFIIFAGHPSLRFGDAPYLIDTLGKSSENSIVFTDCSVIPEVALRAYENVNCGVFSCPFDPRLSRGEANQLISQCRPQTLIIPHEYSSNSDSTNGGRPSHFTSVLPLCDLVNAENPEDFQTIKLKSLERVTALKSQLPPCLPGLVDPDLTHTIKLKRISDEVRISAVDAFLHTGSDYCTFSTVRGKHTSVSQDTLCDMLTPKSTSSASNKRARNKSSLTKLSKVSTPSITNASSYLLTTVDRKKVLLGSVDPRRLLADLHQFGFRDASILESDSSSSIIINLPSIHGKITCWDIISGASGTECVSSISVELCDEESRKLIQAAIMNQLVSA